MIFELIEEANEQSAMHWYKQIGRTLGKRPSKMKFIGSTYESI